MQTLGQPLGTADALSRGIVGVRANTFSNTASVSGDYALSRRLSLRGNYNNSIFRVGSILAQPTETADFPIVYFNTNFQTFSVGPSYRLTRGDSLGLNYQGTFMNLSGGGTSSISLLKAS